MKQSQLPVPVVEDYFCLNYSYRKVFAQKDLATNFAAQSHFFVLLLCAHVHLALPLAANRVTTLGDDINRYHQPKSVVHFFSMIALKSAGRNFENEPLTILRSV